MILKIMYKCVSEMVIQRDLQIGGLLTKEVISDFYRIKSNLWVIRLVESYKNKYR